MITEDRKRDTKKPKKVFELGQELKKTNGVPNYLKISKELNNKINEGE